MDSPSLATVRAQIKAWERLFQSEHARAPGVDDVRQRPDIQRLYKQHKQLQKAASAKQAAEPTPPLQGFNPFSPKKNSKQHQARSPSTPNPSRSLLPQQTPPNTALSRARKRLRGEPVSPSPNKSTRQRVASVRTTPDSSDEDDNDASVLPALTFIQDSPVKAPSGNKSFKLLFQESRPRTELLPIIPGQSGASERNRHRESSAKVKAAFAPRFPIPGKSDLFSQRQTDSEYSDTDCPALSARNPPKRSFSAHVSDDDDDSKQRRLLCPSPPPIESSHRMNDVKSNAKLKQRSTRKRARTSQGDEDDEDDTTTSGPDDLHVRLFDPRIRRRELDKDDSDDLLGQEAPKAEQVDQGRFEVDVPENMLDILAISPDHSRSKSSHQEKVYRGLVYGRREHHYDPERGGEVWDIGEQSDEVEHDITEGEDDWEGEPIPWEVGEL